jgi:tumor protein p53-inducible protein 3
VTALLTGGGYAEFALCDERHMFKAFPGAEMTTMAAIPEAFVTAYQLCFTIGQAKRGDAVLLHAAASSVGQAAIQMLVRKGVTVFATVRTASKRDRCMELGCKECIVVSTSADPADIQFAAQIIEANDGQPVNIVLDPVGSSYLPETIAVLGTDSKLVLYGLMGGGAVNDGAVLNKLLGKRISLLCTTLRARSPEYKAEIVQNLISDPDCLPAIARGDIKVEVEKIFELAEVIQALEYMSSNANAGKIVLLVSSSQSAINFFEQELSRIAGANLMK